MNTKPISERERLVWPAKKGNRAFSKPASPLCESAEAAIAACNDPTYKGDFLVKHIFSEQGYRWQVWLRRATARGAAHPRDYEFLYAGRRAKRHAAGEGLLFVETMP